MRGLGRAQGNSEAEPGPSCGSSLVYPPAKATPRLGPRRPREPEAYDADNAHWHESPHLWRHGSGAANLMMVPLPFHERPTARSMAGWPDAMCMSGGGSDWRCAPDLESARLVASQRIPFVCDRDDLDLIKQSARPSEVDEDLWSSRGMTLESAAGVGSDDTADSDDGTRTLCRTRHVVASRIVSPAPHRGWRASSGEQHHQCRRRAGDEWRKSQI
jgi:hypothetical protein